ncbi:FUSC family protein [Puia sp. P3]|uniref:FUSC family protein n=1 Tax=Puia sp. P3 TaxID=3423952 RepID=UPI003D678F4D
MKPVHSLTKKRNFERLMGTLGGALVGLVILYFIKDPRVLFVLMILFMIGTYVFLRTNYLAAVIFTTPYVLLLFHLLYPIDFRTILTDRVIDTVIGSVIAFLANILIIPSWEHERITDYMTGAIEANIDYFRDVAGAFLGRPSTVHQYKLSRKKAFVALANLSDAFGRMLSEPRRQQKRITDMHQFVVSNHMLTSHTATLAYYVDPFAAKFADGAYEPLVNDIVQKAAVRGGGVERRGLASGNGGAERRAARAERPTEQADGTAQGRTRRRRSQCEAKGTNEKERGTTLRRSSL